MKVIGKGLYGFGNLVQRFPIRTINAIFLNGGEVIRLDMSLSMFLWVGGDGVHSSAIDVGECILIVI